MASILVPISGKDLSLDLTLNTPHVVSARPRARDAIARVETLVPSRARLSRRDDRARPKVTGRLEADKNLRNKADGITNQAGKVIQYDKTTHSNTPAIKLSDSR